MFSRTPSLAPLVERRAAFCSVLTSEPFIVIATVFSDATIAFGGCDILGDFETARRSVRLNHMTIRAAVPGS
jgi:hypothetical protein